MVIKEELQEILEGEVLDDEKTLDEHSRDASIFEVKPELVVFPKNVEDIKKLVTYATEKNKNGERVYITPRAAGTDMGGGPLGESIILNFTRHFNNIKSVTRQAGIAEPGVFYRDFEKEASKKGVFFPPFPASKDLCAMGGIVANNSGGEKTLIYGKAEKYIPQIKAVLADGKEYVLKSISIEELEKKMKGRTFESNLYRKLFRLIKKNQIEIEAARPEVSKNSAGYNLWDIWRGNTFDITKLFVGSQGTLGIITEAEFKLEPIPKYSRLVVMFLSDLKPLGFLVPEILKYAPESFESYDDHTLKLALRFMPELARKLKTKNMLKLAWSFMPEALMLLRGGWPKLVLLAEFSGNDEAELDKKARTLAASLRRDGINARMAKNQEDEKKYWTIRRESFSLLRKHVGKKRTAPFIDDIIVRPEKLGEFLPKLQVLLAKYRGQMEYTIAGHIGDGNFHIIPLMDFRDPLARAAIPKASDEVYNLVLEFGGSITAEHNDGLIRSPYLEKMYGPKAYRLFGEVKNIFDPLNIFNPGKKYGANLDYAFDHMAK